jgi:hypothetical protein
MKPGAPLLQSTRLLDQVRERIWCCTIASRQEGLPTLGVIFHPLECNPARRHPPSALCEYAGHRGVFECDGQR